MDYKDQLEKVTHIIDAFEPKLGSVLYILDAIWYKNWREYCENPSSSSSSSSSPPGLIKTKELLKLGKSHGIWPELRDGLIEDRDFVSLPEDAWQFLFAIYGSGDVAPIPRRIIFDGYELALETSLYKVKIKMLDHMREISVSSLDTIADLKYYATNYLKSQVNFYPSQLDKLSYYIAKNDEKVDVTSKIFNEVRLKDLGLFLPDAHVELVYIEGNEFDQCLESGLVGLRNLGNTCYMNSAIQCLSNCEPLTRYFVSGNYLRDLNREVFMGSGELVAVEYGALIKTMWRLKEFGVTSPEALKNTLGHIENRFYGFQQQDSQELLATLLDRLHEDLNRAGLKRHIEQANPDGITSEHDIADEAWRRYKLKNDSIIVDKFYGQFRSKITCPVCSWSSVTFDPFLFLSLPIPSSIVAKVVIVQGVTAKYITFPIDPHCETIDDLVGAIANLMGVVEGDWVATEVFNHKIYQIFPGNFAISKINFSTVQLFIYQAVSLVDYYWVALRLATEFGYESRIGFPILICKNKDLTLNQQVENTLRSLFLLTGSPTDPDQIHWSDIYKVDGPERDDMDLEQIQVILDSKAIEGSFKTSIEALLDNFCQIDSPSFAMKKSTANLYKCLDLFTINERLFDEASWYCQNCQKNCQAYKKMDIWRLPDILVVHLKRFSYTHEFGQKISVPVHFPIKELLLSQLAEDSKGPATYDLFAIANHYGGLGGGHYTAFCKNFINERWFEFDDSRVAEISDEQLEGLEVQKSAYLLFYRIVS